MQRHTVHWSSSDAMVLLGRAFPILGYLRAAPSAARRERDRKRAEAAVAARSAEGGANGDAATAGDAEPVASTPEAVLLEHNRLCLDFVRHHLNLRALAPEAGAAARLASATDTGSAGGVSWVTAMQRRSPDAYEVLDADPALGLGAGFGSIVRRVAAKL